MVFSLLKATTQSLVHDSWHNKNVQMRLPQTGNIHHREESNQQMKSQPVEWKNTFTNHVSDIQNK